MGGHAWPAAESDIYGYDKFGLCMPEKICSGFCASALPGAWFSALAHGTLTALFSIETRPS
jgi:hypothetical protein